MKDDRSDVLAELRKLLDEIRHPPMIVRYPQSDEYQQGREEARRIAEQYQHYPPGTAVALPTAEWTIEAGGDAALRTAIDRICWLLGMADTERSFVQSLAADPLEQAGIAAFADWLEDQGRPEDATAMKRLLLTPDAVVVVTYDEKKTTMTPAMAESLRSAFPDNRVVVVPEILRLDFSAQQMTAEDVKYLASGVYNIFWKEGGISVASVGRTGCGDVWMAPSNWINVPTTEHWGDVHYVQRLA